MYPDGTRMLVSNMGSDTVSIVDVRTYAVIATIPVGSSPNAYGECVGPGVPRYLMQDAVARLTAVKARVEANADGVISPALAIEQLAAAIEAGSACLQDDLWSADDAGQADPRRLDTSQGGAVFRSGISMVDAVLKAVRHGWITGAELRGELLAIADEAVRADRVLAAVAMDDAIMAGAKADALAQVQAVLVEGDTRVREAGLGHPLDRKAALLGDAIDAFQRAWEAALGLEVP
jgi:YVTN family beta-propeller protein